MPTQHLAVAQIQAPWETFDSSLAHKYKKMNQTWVNLQKKCHTYDLIVTSLFYWIRLRNKAKG